MRDASRRQFVKSSIAATFAAGLETSLPRSMLRESFPGETPAAVRADSAAIQKGVLLEMLPDKLSYADRFKMAREVGFEVVQAPTTPDERIAEEIKKAADAASIRIDSVMNMDHWKYPLSSSDPAVVDRSLAGMRTSLHNAKLWGADAVLLVPAVVDPQTSYRDAWTRERALALIDSESGSKLDSTCVRALHTVLQHMPAPRYADRRVMAAAS